MSAIDSQCTTDISSPCLIKQSQEDKYDVQRDLKYNCFINNYGTSWYIQHFWPCLSLTHRNSDPPATLIWFLCMENQLYFEIVIPMTKEYNTPKLQVSRKLRLDYGVCLNWWYLFLNSFIKIQLWYLYLNRISL